MIYYIVLLFGILLADAGKNSNLLNGRSKKIVPIFAVFIVLICFYTFRYRTISGDSNFYVELFLTGKNIPKSFSDLIKSSEPLFALVYYIRYITSSYQVFFFVVSLPLCLGLTFIYKEESENFFLSFLILCVLGIISFCMAGLRQSMAMGFCFMAYPFIKKKRIIPFLIFVAIAYGFHNSAIVFLLAIPIRYIKTNSFYFVFAILFFILGYIKSPIINKIGSLFTDSRFGSYFSKERATVNYTVYIIQFILVAFCFLYKKEVCEKDENANFLYNLAIVGLCIQPLTNVVAEFFRLSMYFSVFTAFLVTKAIACENNEKIRVAEIIMISVVFIFYLFVIRGVEWLPFWFKG